MGKSSSDFERFLYANYPDDYRRATVEDVPDDVLTAILSRHARHYQIWNEIPEWIKNIYHDKLPAEVLNGNETVQSFVQKEQTNKKEEEDETRRLIDYGVGLLALGYASETVAVLMENRQAREQLLKQAGGKPLTGELFEKWIQTRESDKQAIEKDWQENSPEKYIFHLVKEVNRREKKLGKSGVDEATLLAEKGALEQKLQDFMGQLTDKKSKQKMIDYLRQAPQQAALKHLQPEAMSLFTGLLEEQGLKLKPVAQKGKGQTIEVKREGMVDVLKGHYERFQKMKGVLANKYRCQNQAMEGIGARSVAEDKADEDLDRMITLRRNARQKSA